MFNALKPRQINLVFVSFIKTYVKFYVLVPMVEYFSEWWFSSLMRIYVTTQELINM